MAAPARFTVALLALGAGALPGCAAPAEEVELPVAVPESFAESGSLELPERWWTAFGDPGLELLVERALHDNLDLEAAWQRLREARALAERERSFLVPDLSLEANAQLRRPADGEGESLVLGPTSVYEVDLWGRVRAAAEAEGLRAHASLADYRAAAVSLSAEVALAWFRLGEARDQRALLDEQIATNEQVLSLIETRFATGLVPRVDVLRQRQLVEATRAQRISAAARVEAQEHLLAVLLGRAPRAGLGLEPAPVPSLAAMASLPPLPEAGLPADLVRRRPDLRRAYALVLAADRDVAAAVRDRYPALTLAASLSTTDAGADELFEDWVASLAAGLFAPLFDAGRRAAEVERNEALKLQRLHEYGQATLVAFREVEDALVLEREQALLIESLEQQHELGDRAYERLRTEYLNGFGDYIDVLTALTEQQRLRRELLSARLFLLEARVALHRALAGGFETEREVAWAAR